MSIVVFFIAIYTNLILYVDAGYTHDMFAPMMTLIRLRFPILENLSMLEFGDQQFFGWFPEEYGIAALSPAKHYFESLGIRHVSIDINGRHGSLPLDVRQPLQPNTHFNIITNTGFSEHVGEGDVEANLVQNQYRLFKNLHDVGSMGSVYWHFVPTNRHWVRHGVCDYSVEFFAALVEANGYESILASMVFRNGGHAALNMAMVMFAKRNVQPFMSIEAFAVLPGLHSTYEDYTHFCDVYVDKEHFVADNRDNEAFHQSVADICRRHYLESVQAECVAAVHARCQESYTLVPNSHDIQLT